jgi:hypothetical protein
MEVVRGETEGAQSAPRRSGAGRRGPASDGVGGSGGAKPPGKKCF